MPANGLRKHCKSCFVKSRGYLSILSIHFTSLSQVSPVLLLAFARMETLSIGLSTSPPLLNYPNIRYSTSKCILPIPNPLSTVFSTSQPRHFLRTICSTPKQPHQEPRIQIPVYQSSSSQGSTACLHFNEIFVRSHVSFFSMGFFFPLSCLASEYAIVPTEEVSNKINLEAIIASIDEFFNKNPFFVAGVTFIWLVVVPLAQEYFRKYKFTSAIDAFRKLRDDPDCQLLDIRDKKSLDFLNSPNLKLLNKGVLQVEFREGDEEGFVKQLLGIFKEPESTRICIMDNFDGNSIKVAELLAKNGFKEAYAIKGGIRGKKGWQEIQETLLPPSVHIYPRKKVRESEEQRGVDSPNKGSDPSPSVIGPFASQSEETSNGSIKKFTQVKSGTKCVPRSLSPYPNYPELKPPSSPTPSKPDK